MAFQNSISITINNLFVNFYTLKYHFEKFPNTDQNMHHKNSIVGAGADSQKVTFSKLSSTVLLSEYMALSTLIGRVFVFLFLVFRLAFLQDFDSDILFRS